ncbi:MAG: 4-hydroxy-tetrahydrodipicolinate reductase [Ferruginibacter sp.]
MKIAIIGYGKMGKAIEQISIEKGHQVILKITSKNKHDITVSNLQQADVAIEFTNPGNAVSNIYACIDAGIPVVCGSTGWLDGLEKVSDYCIANNGTLLYASNFSIGVNIFFELNKRLAELMADQAGYDVSIVEVHHKEKKDSPSGTAIILAEQLINKIQGKSQWVNLPSKNADDLFISSLRIDNAPGTHTVSYTSEIDDITITHNAHNRKGFAFGAVLAAEFLNEKKGVFNMKDVLGI